MKYLKSYETYIDYQEAFNNGEIEAPNVSLIKDEARCLYHPKYKSDFGDVVLFDRDTNQYLFVDPDSYLEGFWHDLRKYPIGVVAIPTKYTPDGSTRVVSLKNMSMKDPVNGSTKTGGVGGENSMYWGGNGVDIPGLKNYNQVVNIDPVTWEPIGLIDWVRIPSDTSFRDTGQIDPDGRYYYSTPKEEPTRRGPYPILGNGEKNPLFYEYTNSAMTDFNGKENTEIIVAMAEGTSYANWKTVNQYTHGYAAGNYPPAFCCKRYKTLYGTNSGDWYLPAIGEVMFLTSHYGAINKGLNAVATARGSSEAIRLGRDGTYGNWLWSSSEYSRATAGSVYCLNGRCYYSGKSNTDAANRVRSFLCV